MAPSVSRAQKKALLEEFSEEVAEWLFDLLEAFAFSLSPDLSPENEDDRRRAQQAVDEFLDSYMSERFPNVQARVAAEDAPSREQTPRQPRRTDPEGLEWRLRVFRGRAFALRRHDLPTQPQVKAIRTEAGNLLTDLPVDHEARDEVFAILCAADDIVE